MDQDGRQKSNSFPWSSELTSPSKCQALPDVQELPDAIDRLFIPFNGICHLLIHLSLRPATAEVDQPRIVLIVDEDVAGLSVTPYHAKLVQPIHRLTDLAGPFLPRRFRYRLDVYSRQLATEHSRRNSLAEETDDTPALGVLDVAAQSRHLQRPASRRFGANLL
ncbi:hypothetical protein H2204_001255 [Knufia peltigerae]|uniref:Uncharacterized protein n=1 Tax=Knufia peltigerae TaxID=1002370 RepID=A0AA38YCX9_9EURO|nr:hypothetical protein H2204_001255 [Knufia peltigerae]